MYTILLLLTLFGSALASPQRNPELLRAYALNPAEINNIYFNPHLINRQRDIAPQPLIRPDASVEETVREVEELIRKDPRLPRLTRGEIIDIIENITKSDIGNKLKNPREEGKRALMVVMPFTAGSAQGDDIKELYTRTPVTRIIGNDEHKQNERAKNKTKKPPRKWEISMLNEVVMNTKGENEIPKFQFLPEIKSSTTTEKPIKKTATTKRRRPDIKQEQSTTINLPIIRTTSKPDKKYTNHKYEEPSAMQMVAPSFFMTVNDDVGYSPPYIVKMKRPQMQPEVTIEEVKITPDMYGDTPKPKPKLEFKTTTPKIIWNKVEEEKLSKYTKTHKTSSRIPQTITDKNLNNEIQNEYVEENKTKPVISSTTEKTNKLPQASSILEDMSIPDNYKGVIKDLDLLITPENHKTPYTQQILKPVHPDVPKLSHSTTSMPDISNVANNLSPEMKDLLVSFGLINRPSEKSTSSTTEEIPHFQNAQVNPESYVRFKPLPINSPGRNDMEELLSRFGLGRSSLRGQKSIDYDKKQKTMNKISEFDLDAVPDNLKSVVRELGLTQNHFQETKGDRHIFKPNHHENSTEEELKKLGKLLDMIKDLERMKGNITEASLKGFDAGTLKELIGNFNGNIVVPLDEKDVAFNPEQFEYGITKGGFKRDDETQTTTELMDFVTVTPSSNGDSSSDSSSSDSTSSGSTSSGSTSTDSTSTDSTSSDSTSNTSSTSNTDLTSDSSSTTNASPLISDSFSDESKANHLQDLEDSFGGEVEVPATTTEEPTTTTTPRTGFYYLLDWNTFWEMDNQNGKRINLRFQPHAGNPRYFLNVAVP